MRHGRFAIIAASALVLTGAAASVALGRQHALPVIVTYPDSSAPAKIGLHGVVGPGFTITLTDANNNPITWLQPGTYTFTIDDLSNIHDFHLTGPGVDLQTAVPDTGTTSWTVKLTPGSYTYVCDPHAAIMNGSFGVAGYGTVTSFPAPKTVAHAVKRTKHRR